jgi:hypothetical protein
MRHPPEIRPNAHVDSDETVLFRCEPVLVTDRRILFHTRSYAVSAVSSVAVEEQKPRKPKRRERYSPESIVGTGMIVLGAALGAGGAYMAAGSRAVTLMLLGFGGIIVTLGLILIFNRRPAAPRSGAAIYSVRISTVDGERGRVNGLDQDTARRLANAISNATAQR